MAVQEPRQNSTALENESSSRDTNMDECSPHNAGLNLTDLGSKVSEGQLRETEGSLRSPRQGDADQERIEVANETDVSTSSENKVTSSQRITLDIGRVEMDATGLFGETDSDIDDPVSPEIRAESDGINHLESPEKTDVSSDVDDPAPLEISVESDDTDELKSLEKTGLSSDIEDLNSSERMVASSEHVLPATSQFKISETKKLDKVDSIASHQLTQCQPTQNNGNSDSSAVDLTGNPEVEQQGQTTADIVPPPQQTSHTVSSPIFIEGAIRVTADQFNAGSREIETRHLQSLRALASLSTHHREPPGSRTVLATPSLDRSLDMLPLDYQPSSIWETISNHCKAQKAVTETSDGSGEKRPRDTGSQEEKTRDSHKPQRRRLN